MIIAIGGISRSGKTFLAEKLCDFFQDQALVVSHIDQDEYVLPEHEIPRIRDHVDWEIPESVDWEKFTGAIHQASRKNDIVLVEGLLVFSRPELLSLFDFTIFLTLKEQVFVERKRNDLRWGKEPEWYIEYIWQAHKKYGQMPQGRAADLILNADELIDWKAVSEKILIKLRAMN